MSIFITKEITPLKCHRCGHFWNYGGNNKFIACCPHCRTFLTIRKHRVLQSGFDSAQPQTVREPQSPTVETGGKRGNV